MCGIVGYIGHKEAFPILIKGLRRLEYRGYDSAGVALINDDNSLNVYKSKGKVDNLVEYCKDKNVSGTVGIAHTRWATHGEPSSRNAHPHYSESKNLAIIHNGIIENYAELKEKLKAKGVNFVSDTDTEVLVQLIEYIKEHKQLDLLTVPMPLPCLTSAIRIRLSLPVSRAHWLWVSVRMSSSWVLMPVLLWNILTKWFIWRMETLP